MKIFLVLVNICRTFNSKVPTKPYIVNIKSKHSAELSKIDTVAINHLERLSLVNFGNLKGVEILQSSVKFAEQLLGRDTTGIKPLTSVLEYRALSLRKDEVKDGNCRKSIMVNAKVTEEEYFVAPPGNIPVEPHNTKYSTEEQVSVGKK